MIQAFTVLRYRDYAVYAAARFLNSLGWGMLSVAVGWQVYQLTHNALLLGLIGLSQFLPFVLLVLPAGHVADRSDRRLVLVAAYAVQSGCAGVLLLFTLSGSTQVWPIFAAMILAGCARAFSMPTTQAMVPNLVPREVFPQAVAFNSVSLEIATIVGPSLGGVLYLLGPLVVYGVAFALGWSAEWPPSSWWLPTCDCSRSCARWISSENRPGFRGVVTLGLPEGAELLQRLVDLAP